MAAFLDTHAAIYLAEGEIGRFGSESRSLLESDDLLISPFVKLELAFLRECGKIGCEANEVIGLLAGLGVAFATDTAQRVTEDAMALRWTRDPFDRLITATASLHDAPLITRDRIIAANYGRAVW